MGLKKKSHNLDLQLYLTILTFFLQLWQQKSQLLHKKSELQDVKKVKIVTITYNQELQDVNSEFWGKKSELWDINSELWGKLIIMSL